MFSRDVQPAPSWLVSHQLGEEWDHDGKAYNSIITSYVPHSNPFGDSSHSKCLDVYVGLGILINHKIISPVSALDVSFVTRNQVLLWIREHTMKAPARGVVVVVSTSSYSLKKT